MSAENVALYVWQILEKVIMIVGSSGMWITNFTEENRTFLDNTIGQWQDDLFRCLCGLERPEEGEVSEMDAFSVQFQEDRLCEDCSAVKNLEMILGDASQARTALTWLLPEEALGQPCHELSGGMKRRVSLVRAMEAGAQCVLLDEPFTGLDEENREKAEDYIRRKTKWPDHHDSHSYQNRGRICRNEDARYRNHRRKTDYGKRYGKHKVTLIGIIVEDKEAAGRINGLLHEYGEYIIRKNGDTLS